MPAEKRGAAGASEASASKKRKMSSSPLLRTPSRVLDLVEQGEPLTETRVLQALCNAVISASVEKNEDKDALQLLAELLAQDAVDPNAGDEALWDIYGGSPLYQACALDLPDATKLLLNHGASVVQVYKGQTPLEVALANEDSNCVKVIMEHIGRLEKKAREGRDKDTGRHTHGSRCQH